MFDAHASTKQKERPVARSAPLARRREVSRKRKGESFTPATIASARKPSAFATSHRTPHGVTAPLRRMRSGCGDDGERDEAENVV